MPVTQLVVDAHRRIAVHGLRLVLERVLLEQRVGLIADAPLLPGRGANVGQQLRDDRIRR